MKKIRHLFFLLSFIGVYSFSNAQQITTVSINSTELSHHVLDSISNKSIQIYLPPSYNNSEEIYPVLYFLPGYGCGYFKKSALINSYHNGINNGNFKEMIVVFVDGCTENTKGCFYLNSEVTGNWDDFIASNVVSYIDSQYRTIASPASRAIAGHSMGGFGALHLAMLFPDIFGSVYSQSPGLFSLTGLKDSQMFSDNTNIEAYIKFEEELSSMSKEEAHKAFLSKLYTVNNNLRFTIEYGMAVAPNLGKKAPYVDFPYTKVDNELVKNNSLWEKWESGFGGFDVKVPEYKSNLLALDTIVIDYGTNDYYGWIPDGCRYVSSVLSSNNIPNKLVSYAGGHGNMDRYVTVMFPAFMKSMRFDTLSVNSTSVDDSHTNKSDITVSYNPNHYELTIFCEESLKGNTYKILDIKGRTIRTGFLDDNIISTGELPKGFYIISIMFNGEIISSKFLLG
jgi:enterochelin esterase-like enzyme